ncbi:MAG: chemotaxis protein CheC, partial [Campylobacteraceae bacterium]|nr:chemotaxis protein CheC [Campylobacteraceae bacterium]
MNTQIALDEDQQDCLQELMNIAYGSATAAISSILDAFATLNVPQISVIDAANLKQYLLDNIEVENTHFISSQTLNGKIAGECLFVIGEQSSINLAKEFGVEDEEIT